jgi:hypothetical protein
MRYRAALARSFEPSARALRRLLAAAAASEGALFRAALVRLAARASGARRSLLFVCRVSVLLQ